MNATAPLFLAATTTASKTRFPAALKKLSKHGVDALKPSFRMHGDQKVWRPAMISKRKAKTLRKEAILNGSFGKFEPNVGGWDPMWDVQVLNPHSKGRFPNVQPPKLPRHQRTREERAQKLEQKLEGMDDRIRELYQEKADAKPEKSFDTTYKQIMAKKRK